MKKTISLFCRNYEGDHLVRDELVPGAEWVAAGEGVATVKWDGSACLWKDGRLWRRYEWKKAKGKPAPDGFLPAQDPDPITGDQPGWVPVREDNPADQWHVKAASDRISRAVPFYEDGATYEIVGPHFQKNPYHLERDMLLRHGVSELPDAPRDFAGLREYLKTATYPVTGPPLPIEGIVWWHPDGRLVKIKAKDFGLPWPPRTAEKR